MKITRISPGIKRKIPATASPEWAEVAKGGLHMRVVYPRAGFFAAFELPTPCLRLLNWIARSAGRG